MITGGQNTMRRAQQRPTLVTVGTGKIGRRVAERLTARGVPVRLGSRSSKPPFDWNDPETWAGALYRVESVFVSYYPDLAVPGAMGAVRSFTDLAVQAGVQRLHDALAGKARTLASRRGTVHLPRKRTERGERRRRKTTRIGGHRATKTATLTTNSWSGTWFQQLYAGSVVSE
jgi:hypothetical protein